LLSCFSVVRHEINEETETNLQDDSTPYRETPASAESAYDQLTAYGFARRYVKGKVVVDIGREGVGYGSRLLAETAESVTALSGLPEVVELASAAYDAVVAFGVVENLERPEDLVKEAKRVLKEDGVLLISATDRQTDINERNRRDADGQQEMYVPEFREMLERHFGYVRLYRQGAVAGGLVFPATGEEPIGAPVEVARFSVAAPRFGVRSPVTRSVIAVCSDSEGAMLGGEEGSYLLLDRDRWVFVESEERAEDVELLRAEILRMQDSEVRAFVDVLRREILPLRVLLRLASRVLLSYLYGYWKANLQAMFRRRQEITFEEARRRELTLEEGRHRRNLVLEQARHHRNTVLEPILHRRNIIRGNIYAIRKKGPRDLVQGAFRRSYDLYWRLRNEDRGPDPNLRSKYERNQTG
jgi:SAM-dependent methyltransferase